MAAISGHVSPFFMLQTMYRQMVIRSLRKQGSARGLSVYVPALSLVSPLTEYPAAP